MIGHPMPWEKEYSVFGIPKTLEPYPRTPVFDILDATAERFPRTGLIQLGLHMPYPEVKKHVDSLANALMGIGLRKGDRVATLLPTSIQFVIADYGISRAGLVHVPCSFLESMDTLNHKFLQAAPRAMICLNDHIDMAAGLMRKQSISHLIVTRMEDYSESPPVETDAIGFDGAVRLRQLIEAHPPTPPGIFIDVDRDLELLLFTGGTTGLPKGCMLTHKNIHANAIQGSKAFGMGAELLKGAISVLLGLPFFHSYGHIIMHTMTLNGYNQILIADPRDTAVMVAMIKQYRPLMQIGVPTQFLKISGEELKGIGMLGLSGSAPLPPSTQKKFEETSGGGIMEGYGLSEMSPVTHLNTTFLLRLMRGRTFMRMNTGLLKLPGVLPVLNRLFRLLGPKFIGSVVTSILPFLVKSTARAKSHASGGEKRGTIGIPCPDTEIRLIDTATEAPISPEAILAGGRGEMCLKGPQRMLGYWPEPGSGLDREGYVRTGDVVQVDAQGYFYIVDRTKDMINVSGYKIYSREIDDLLNAHPGVEMAGTVGIPDPEREGSERVVVFVQPRPEFRDRLTTEEIIEYLSTRVARYAVPKHVRIEAELPLTDVQKLDKKALRAQAKKLFVEDSDSC